MKKIIFFVLFATIVSFQFSIIDYQLLNPLCFAHEGHADHNHNNHDHSHHDQKKRCTFIVGNYMTQGIVRTIKTIWKEYPYLKDQIRFELISKTDINSRLDENEVYNADLIIFDVHGIRISTSTQTGFDAEILKEVIDKGGSVLAVGQTAGLDPQYTAVGLIYDKEIRSYLEHRSAGNMQNMILLSLKKYLNFPDIDVKPPQKGLKMAYYHNHKGKEMLFQTFNEYKEWYKSTGYFDKDADWISVLTYSSFLEEGHNAVEDELVHILEKKGFNTFVAFGYPAAKAAEELLIDSKGNARVSGVLSFIFRFSDFKASKMLKKLGVPVINLITVYGKDGKEWETDPEGLSSLEVSWQLAIPEIAGLIQPTVVAYRIRERDKETGFFVERRRPVSERVDRATDRMKTWIDLQKKENSKKKVAIFYWNYPPGKQHIGASYLNVFASIENVLEKMKSSGYTVGEESINKELLLKTSLKYGRNIGNWAPGELDEMAGAGRCLLLPLDDYILWSKNLPIPFMKEINNDWGDVEESNLMVWTNPKDNKKYMVIPAIQRGNVVILPQPVRGWLQDKEAMYHDDDLWPHHQYAGVYAWLKFGFKADTIIHFGTHGTHEWLPGKSNGLSGDDPPEALVHDLPVIYPYIVDDVGEGLVAKRRGSAVVIDHMIPPLKKGGLYHEYAELEELISDHHRALDQNEVLASQYMANIIKKIKSLGLEKDIEISESLDINAKDGDPHRFDHEVIHKIEEYLKELKQINMPYGLHTFGDAPNESLRKSTIKAIKEVAKDIPDKELDDNILKGAKRELANTINAMSGRYISTGTGNDPVRNPESLPTGKNFYAFNPDKIPKKEAWQVGIKLTDKLLKKYKAKHDGKYPEKLAFVIWGTETIRHEGILESQILYLLGVRPVWNEWGKVTGIQLIPRDKLGRPRIDIVVSSAAEEMFGQLTHYIDQAVQMVKQLKENDNHVRKHFLEITEKLIKQGWDKKRAEQYAAVRIFDEPPGRYDLNVSRITSASGTWEDDSVVAEDYFRHMSYGYGNGLWGEPMEDVYKEILSGTEMVLHSRSTNLYGTLDNDDFFMYAGGLVAAVRELDDKSPELMVTNIMNPVNPEMTSIDRMMGMELRSRYWNPKWIEGMKKEGYEGANKMAEFVENMWGWQVTVPETIDSARWEQTFEVYVEDKYGMDLKEFFAETNPWAQQAISARMLEVDRKGYWKASEEMKKSLAKTYAVSVIENGVACCEHTCNNPAFNQFVANVISMTGICTPQQLADFKLQIAKATGKKVEDKIEDKTAVEPEISTVNLSKKIEKVKEPVSESTEEKKQAEKNEPEKKTIEGFEMVEEKSEETSVTTSGISWIVIGIVVGILSLLFIGWKRNKV